MKTLFFDCSSGISGNMVLGALTELLGDEGYLIRELEKLKVDGCQIAFSKMIKNGITGTHVEVKIRGEEAHHSGHGHATNSSHGHSHHHPHRNLADVNAIIEESTLGDGVRDLAKRIFLRVAQAESKVHSRPLNEVHFHEVGALDSIVDIVGTAILIDALKPERIVSSVVNDGWGFIECAHGTMSVPVPATSEIFAAGRVAGRQIDIETELVTPTGAAIIAELAESFGTMPRMEIEKIGWGAGTKELKIPNVLKVCMGDSERGGGGQREDGEEIIVMEANIDDCSGEILGYAMEKLLAAGALDVFYVPVYMKKNRPACVLSVICRETELEKLRAIVFRETTTIGVRYRKEYRTALCREEAEIATEYGTLKAKKVSGQDFSYIYPEYESARKLAEEKNIPLKELYRWNYKQS